MFILSLFVALVSVTGLAVASCITVSSPAPRLTRAELHAYGYRTGWGDVIRALEPARRCRPTPNPRLQALRAATEKLHTATTARLDAVVARTVEDTRAPALPYVVDFYTCGHTHGAKVLTADNRIVSILVAGLSKLTDDAERVSHACDYYMAHC